jgi:signal transduction histidine kinase
MKFFVRVRYGTAVRSNVPPRVFAPPVPCTGASARQNPDPDPGPDFDPARSAEHLVATLVPGFVHEMNNALNAIVGLAHLLADVIEQTADLDCVRDIESAGYRATELVASMRRLADGGALAREWRPANEAVAASARVARLMLPRRSTVEVRADASPDRKVDAAAVDRVAGLLAAAWARIDARARNLRLSVTDGPNDDVELALADVSPEPGPAPDLDETAWIIAQLGGELRTEASSPSEVRARLPARSAS